MRGEPIRPTICVLVFLAIAGLACGGGDNEDGGVAQVTPTERSQPVDTETPESPAQPEATEVAQVTPTEQSQSVDTEMPESPAQPEATEVAPGRVQKPEASETSEDGVESEWKRDLDIVTGGLTGETTCVTDGVLPTLELPAIKLLDEDALWSRHGTRTLCLYGFPFDGPIEIHLSAQRDHLVKGVFLVESPTVMPMDVQQLEPEVRDEAGVPRPGAQLVDGVTVLSVPLWWPVSLPSGIWSVNVVAMGVKVQAPVRVMPRTGIGISTRPAANINPFINQHCKEYRPGDDVIIDGSGFEPGHQLGLGIYRDLGASAELVEVLWTMTDERGRFARPFTVPENYDGGTHFIVPGRVFLRTGPDSGIGSLQRGDEPCFQVVRP